MLTENPLLLHSKQNTNSARQVQFTERKSSHTGIELTQRPSKAPDSTQWSDEVPLPWSHYTVTHLTKRE